MVKKFTKAWYDSLTSAKDLDGKSLFLSKSEYKKAVKRYDDAIKNQIRERLKNITENRLKVLRDRVKRGRTTINRRLK